MNIQSDKVSVELNCYIDSKEKYCLLKEALNTSGEHILKIKNNDQLISSGLSSTKDNSIN